MGSHEAAFLAVRELLDALSKHCQVVEECLLENKSPTLRPSVLDLDYRGLANEIVADATTDLESSYDALDARIRELILRQIDQQAHSEFRKQVDRHLGEVHDWMQGRFCAQELKGLPGVIEQIREEAEAWFGIAELMRLCEEVAVDATLRLSTENAVAEPLAISWNNVAQQAQKLERELGSWASFRSQEEGHVVPVFQSRALVKYLVMRGRSSLADSVSRCESAIELLPSVPPEWEMALAEAKCTVVEFHAEGPTELAGYITLLAQAVPNIYENEVLVDEAHQAAGCHHGTALGALISGFASTAEEQFAMANRTAFGMSTRKGIAGLRIGREYFGNRRRFIELLGRLCERCNHSSPSTITPDSGVEKHAADWSSVKWNGVEHKFTPDSASIVAGMMQEYTNWGEWRFSRSEMAKLGGKEGCPHIRDLFPTPGEAKKRTNPAVLTKMVENPDLGKFLIVPAKGTGRKGDYQINPAFPRKAHVPHTLGHDESPQAHDESL